MMLTCRQTASVEVHHPAGCWGWLVALFALFSAVSFGGCEGAGNKLIGVWRIDSGEELAERMTGDSGESRLGKLAGDAAKSLIGDDFVAGRMEVEFMRGGQLRTSTIVMNAPSEKRGTWVLEKVEGDVLSVRCQIKDEDVLTRVRFEGDDTIYMIPPNVNVLREEFRFKRVK